MRADCRAVLDACVLLPMPLADTLLRLAESPRLYAPQWTDDIMAEVTRNLIRVWRMHEDRARYREAQLREHFPEAWVSGYEELIPSMTNDPGDRHVLAAAVCCRANVIVTFNARHFPDTSLAPWSIERKGPSTFLRNLYDLDPALVVFRLHEQAEAIGLRFEDLLIRLRKNVPAFVSSVCEELGLDLPP